MNCEGYKDPTADEAIGRVMKETKKKDKAAKLIKTLQAVAHLAGFDIVGRIKLREHGTGRTYE